MDIWQYFPEVIFFEEPLVDIVNDIKSKNLEKTSKYDPIPTQVRSISLLVQQLRVTKKYFRLLASVTHPDPLYLYASALDSSTDLRAKLEEYCLKLGGQSRCGSFTRILLCRLDLLSSKLHFGSELLPFVKSLLVKFMDDVGSMVSPTDGTFGCLHILYFEYLTALLDDDLRLLTVFQSFPVDPVLCNFYIQHAVKRLVTSSDNWIDRVVAAKLAPPEAYWRIIAQNYKDWPNSLGIAFKYFNYWLEAAACTYRESATKGKGQITELFLIEKPFHELISTVHRFIVAIVKDSSDLVPPLTFSDLRLLATFIENIYIQFLKPRRFFVSTSFIEEFHALIAQYCELQYSGEKVNGRFIIHENWEIKWNAFIAKFRSWILPNRSITLSSNIGLTNPRFLPVESVYSFVTFYYGLFKMLPSSIRVLETVIQTLSTLLNFSSISFAAPGEKAPDNASLRKIDYELKRFLMDKCHESMLYCMEQPHAQQKGAFDLLVNQMNSYEECILEAIAPPSSSPMKHKDLKDRQIYLQLVGYYYSLQLSFLSPSLVTCWLERVSRYLTRPDPFDNLSLILLKHISLIFASFTDIRKLDNILKEPEAHFSLSSYVYKSYFYKIISGIVNLLIKKAFGTKVDHVSLAQSSLGATVMLDIFDACSGILARMSFYIILATFSISQRAAKDPSKRTSVSPATPSPTDFEKLFSLQSNYFKDKHSNYLHKRHAYSFNFQLFLCLTSWLENAHSSSQRVVPHQLDAILAGFRFSLLPVLDLISKSNSIMLSFSEPSNCTFINGILTNIGQKSKPFWMSFLQHLLAPEDSSSMFTRDMLHLLLLLKTSCNVEVLRPIFWALISLDAVSLLIHTRPDDFMLSHLFQTFYAPEELGSFLEFLYSSSNFRSSVILSMRASMKLFIPTAARISDVFETLFKLFNGKLEAREREFSCLILDPQIHSSSIQCYVQHYLPLTFSYFSQEFAKFVLNMLKILLTGTASSFLDNLDQLCHNFPCITLQRSQPDLQRSSCTIQDIYTTLTLPTLSCQLYHWKKSF